MKQDEVKAGWTLKHITLTLFLYLVTGMGGYFLKYLFEPSASPDYVALNRPYLDPSLFVQHTSPTNSRLHFEIANIGKLPAENIRFLCITPQSKAAELRITTHEKLGTWRPHVFPCHFPIRQTH